MIPTEIIPPGGKAILLGSATGIEDLNAFIPLEEGMPEGALMLARLDFTEYPSIESVIELSQACLDAGVEA